MVDRIDNPRQLSYCKFLIRTIGPSPKQAVLTTAYLPINPLLSLFWDVSAMGRITLQVVGFGFAYFAVASVSLAFSRMDGGLAFVWVATGLLTARLRTSAADMRRRWLAAAGVGSFLATGLFGLGWAGALPMMVVNLAEALLAERILHMAERGRQAGDLPLIGWGFIAACLLAPLATMLPAALVAALATDTWVVSNAGNWLIGHSLGSLTVGPVIALCFRGMLCPWLRKVLTGQDTAGLCTVLLVVVTSAVTFWQDSYPLLFVPTLAVVALTYRAGRQGAAFGVFLLSLTGGLFTLAGHGPVQLMTGSPTEKLQVFQLYLGVTTLTVLPVAAALAARSRLLEVLRESEERYRALADNTTDIVMSLDLQGRLTYISPSIRNYGGHCDRELLGCSALELIDPAFHDTVRDAHARTIAAGGEPVVVEYIGRTGEGEPRWFETNGRCTLDENGHPIGVVGTIRETTTRKTLEFALTQAASTDALTGLANRRAFLEAAEAAATRSDQACIALLDLDHFKRVNDTYGHGAGDHVLREFARLGKAMVRGDDLLARMGGEEFALLLPGASIEAAGVICDRLLQALAHEPMRCDGHVFSVTASGGVSELGGDTACALHRADEALYLAKEAGRARMAMAA